MSHRNDRRDDRIGGYPMSRDGAYLSPEVADSPVDLLSRAARIRQHARPVMPRKCGWNSSPTNWKPGHA
jgi:hypothetical protein